VVREVITRAGRIDALVCSAGLAGPAAASEEIGMHQARQIFEVNFFGAVAMTNTVLPIMRRQGAGRILYISSVGGMVAAMPFYSIYSASKHALEAYAAGLRLEEKEFNIQVALVEPGYTHTGALAQSPAPAHPNLVFAQRREQVLRLDQAGLLFGTPPEEVAALVLRILGQEHPSLHNLSGSDSFWMVLLQRLLPGAWFERLIYWMFYQWRPRSSSGIPSTPRELGLRWPLFHRPTRDRLMRAGLAVGLTAIVVLAQRVLSQKE
jgi:short-subunit dehydrogenase